MFLFEMLQSKDSGSEHELDISQEKGQWCPELGQHKYVRSFMLGSSGVPRVADPCPEFQGRQFC